MWGLPVIAAELERRVSAMCAELLKWDVVCLQEVWHARERDALRTAGIEAGLAFSHHWEHGIGLVITGEPSCS